MVNYDYPVLFSLIGGLLHNYMEILATITGLIYLTYSVEGDKKLWYYGLITSSLYVYVCFIARIYADMGINLYYVVVSVYGIYHWSRDSYKDEKLIIEKSTLANWLLISVTSLVLFLVIYYILNKFTNSDIALADAFTTALSITATWMLARKLIENWLLWIIVDSVSIVLYIYKGLYPTAFLFLVYTGMAVFGYYKWKKMMLSNS